MFDAAVAQAKNLEDVLQGVVPVLAHLREEGATRIGYVSGIITSDGLEHVERNRQQLALHTEQLRQTHAFPLFSPTDIFSDKLFSSLGEMQLPSVERAGKFHQFWRAYFYDPSVGSFHRLFG
jgi:hypothetical protein